MSENLGLFRQTVVGGFFPYSAGYYAVDADVTASAAKDTWFRCRAEAVSRSGKVTDATPWASNYESAYRRAVVGMTGVVVAGQSEKSVSSASIEIVCQDNGSAASTGYVKNVATTAIRVSSFTSAGRLSTPLNRFSSRAKTSRER
jgi:hypothetical protein